MSETQALVTLGCEPGSDRCPLSCNNRVATTTGFDEAYRSYDACHLSMEEIVNNKRVSSCLAAESEARELRERVEEAEGLLDKAAFQMSYEGYQGHFSRMVNDIKAFLTPTPKPVQKRLAIQKAKPELTEEEKECLLLLAQAPMSFKTVSYEHDTIIFDRLIPLGLACATPTAYEVTPAGEAARRGK
jgi:hypothetical protein